MQLRHQMPGVIGSCYQPLADAGVCKIRDAALRVLEDPGCPLIGGVRGWTLAW